MATIEDIALNQTPGKTIRAHNWHSVCTQAGDTKVVSIYHHDTLMLAFVVPPKEARSTDELVLPIPQTYVTTQACGWGSKSDQNGMNRIFRALGMPYYYSRKIPWIIDLLRISPEELKMMPHYLRDAKARVEVYEYPA